MNIDPNLLQQMMQMGDDDPEASSIRRQQAMADRLRSQSMEMPQQRMAGRMVMPTWGESLTNAMAGIKANRMQSDIDTRERAMQSRNADARKRYADALGMALRNPHPNAGRNILPPDGMEDY